MTSPTTEERRNGKERRAMPPEICGEVCKPIVLELNRRDDKLKVELEKTADKVKDELNRKDEGLKVELDQTAIKLHTKLDGIYTCLASKVPSKLFWKIITGFSIFVFGICGAGIVGTLWSIYGTVLQVNEKVAVMAVTLDITSSNLKTHLIRDDLKNDQVDARLNKVEQGETYYRYHDKTERQKKKEMEK